MTEHEIQLLDLLKKRCPPGRPALLELDDVIKTFQLSSLGAYLIGEILYQRTKGLDIAAIGGLECPLTVAALVSYNLHLRRMEGFLIRDPKDHGTKKIVEGNVKPGDRVVIVDVFIQSAVKAVDTITKYGCYVAQVITLVGVSGCIFTPESFNASR